MEKRVLRMSRENIKIFGVCGGIGEFFGIDPIFIRIAFILWLIFFDYGIFAYFLAAFAMSEPVDRGEDNDYGFKIDLRPVD